MKLILCVEDRGGMTFNKRRVSRDKKLIEDLAELVGNDAVYIEPYSEELFSEVSVNLVLSASPMESADEGDYAFIERFDPVPCLDKAEAIILYKWNRRYPFELALSFSPCDKGFRLDSTSEFEGNAHDKITREVYVK